MSAVHLKLLTVLCLSCTALSDPVEWRDFGGAVTIQCRPPEPGQESLTLTRGLKDECVLFKHGNSNKNNTAKEFSDRLQLNGVFPNMDILIKNLTSNDTGPYWCRYTKFDPESSKNEDTKGPGSVLLVVTDTRTHQCVQSNNYLIMVTVGISVATVIGVIILFLILKPKMSTAKKPQRVANNDVYEDMRGTIRR